MTASIKLSCMVPWPRDQQFYVLTQKDVWSDMHRESTGTTNTLRGDKADVDKFHSLAADSMPWKRPCLETPERVPPTPKSFQPATPTTPLRHEAFEFSTAASSESTRVKQEGLPAAKLEYPEYDRAMIC